MESFNIPVHSRERLLNLMRIFEQTNEKTLSSARIESISGWSNHTIRKDISFLGDEKSPAFGSSTGYEPETMITAIKKALGLDKKKKFCIVGLGRLGSAYLNLGTLEFGEFELAAGFDANVNRTEILPSPVPLYPAFKMNDVIQRFKIEIALLCVPAAEAQNAAEKLFSAGIKGIVNFAPSALKLPPDLPVHNVYITDELRSLAIKIKPGLNPGIYKE